jgi:hypothetical protein
MGKWQKNTGQKNNAECGFEDGDGTPELGTRN